jgi:hypothetical protein
MYTVYFLGQSSATTSMRMVSLSKDILGACLERNNKAISNRCNRYIFEIYGDIVSLQRFKKQVSEPITSSLGKYVCLDKNVALSHKIGPILSLHRCRKILV